MAKKDEKKKRRPKSEIISEKEEKLNIRLSKDVDNERQKELARINKLITEGKTAEAKTAKEAYDKKYKTTK